MCVCVCTQPCRVFKVRDSEIVSPLPVLCSSSGLCWSSSCWRSDNLLGVIVNIIERVVQLTCTLRGAVEKSLAFKVY